MRHFILAGALLVSVLAPSVGYASMDKTARTKFVARCEKSMYMSAAQCGCMADIAGKTLDDLAIAYLSLDPLDVTHSAAMAKKMTAAENGAIAKFWASAPKQCKAAK